MNGIKGIINNPDGLSQTVIKKINDNANHHFAFLLTSAAYKTDENRMRQFPNRDSV